jgi:RNA polymerase sigma-70 factor (ECF subfamily)
MVGNHDDTDDVLQNTFIKAFKALEGFQEKSSLFTWLYRIATNEALSFIESSKRKSTVSTDFISQKPDDNIYDSEKIIVKLNSALATLPAKQKIVFNMRYYEEMSYEQMSEILDTSVGALKASYHHALKKIESHLINNAS